MVELVSSGRRWRTPTWTPWWSWARPSRRRGRSTSALRAPRSGSTASSRWCFTNASRRRPRRRTRCIARWAAPSWSAPSSRPRWRAGTCFERPTRATAGQAESQFFGGTSSILRRTIDRRQVAKKKKKVALILSHIYGLLLWLCKWCPTVLILDMNKTFERFLLISKIRAAKKYGKDRNCFVLYFNLGKKRFHVFESPKWQVCFSDVLNKNKKNWLKKKKFWCFCVNEQFRYCFLIQRAPQKMLGTI